MVGGHCKDQIDRLAPDRINDQTVIRKGEPEQRHHAACGAVVQRVFSHDVWHIAEVNEALGMNGLPQIDLWN